MSANYMAQIVGADLARYKGKLNLCGAGLEDCPWHKHRPQSIQYPADLWRNDPQEWPAVEFGDIYIYLVQTPGLKNYYQF